MGSLEGGHFGARRPEKKETRESIKERWQSRRKEAEKRFVKDRADLKKELLEAPFKPGPRLSFNYDKRTSEEHWKEKFSGLGEYLEGFFKDLQRYFENGAPDQTPQTPQADSANPQRSEILPPKPKKTPSALGERSKAKFKPEAPNVKKTFAKHPEWNGYLDSASHTYRVPKNLILGVIGPESGGNPKAKNPDSTAAGLGQILKGTWAGFINANPQFRGRNPYDPEASFHAIAWYLGNIAQDLRVDVKDPNEAWKLYLGYHLGAYGAKKALNPEGRGLSDIKSRTYRERFKNEPNPFKAYSKWAIEKAKARYRAAQSLG